MDSRFWSVLSFFCLLAVLPGTATADPLEACIKAHGQCIATCRNESLSGPKATCIITCGSEEARCAAQTGLAEATPFLKRKLEDLEGFMQDFLEDVIPAPEEKAPPLPEGTET